MNPDGTFVDEDGAAEEYHVTDVSENDRKRLHYLKKQQRKKDHGKKHRPRHRGPAPAPGERRERREPRDPRVLKHHERSGRGMAPKHRDAPGKVNRFQEHLRARGGPGEPAPGAPEEAGRGEGAEGARAAADGRRGR